jgi:hypothetical protein
MAAGWLPADALQLGPDWPALYNTFAEVAAANGLLPVPGHGAPGSDPALPSSQLAASRSDPQVTLRLTPLPRSPAGVFTC